MTAVRLDDLCDIQSGGTPPRGNADSFGGDIPWVKISDIEASDGLITSTEETISEIGLKAIRGRLFPKGTLLFAIYGSVGKSAFAGTDLSANQAVLGIQVRSYDSLSPRYLYHWLQSRQKMFEADAAGIAQKNLSAGYVRSLKIPLPPLNEQIRIAAILDQAEDLRRKRRRALDRLNQLGQAIFTEMFGGSESDTSVFEYLEDIQSGKNLIGVDDGKGSGFRVLKISAVSRNGFRADETKPLPSDYVPPPSHIVKDGDLLFSRANTTQLVGIPCIADGVRENVALPDKLWRLVPSPTKAVSAFICYALLSQSARQQIEKMCSGTSGSMQNISMQKFKSIRVPKASMDQQIAFRRSIVLIDLAKRDLKACRTRADALFQVLQHRAFCGEL